MSLNPTKSIFDASYGKLLSYVVSKASITLDSERLKAIQNLTTPNSKKEFQAFMGKIKFVSRFIPNFAYIIKPVHYLLKSDQTF